MTILNSFLVDWFAHVRGVRKLGGGMVIFDLEIHELEGVPMKSLSIGMLRTVLIIKNGKREVEL